MYILYILPLSDIEISASLKKATACLPISLLILGRILSPTFHECPQINKCSLI